MSDYSDRSDLSDDDTKQQQAESSASASASAPRIKLKLRLNATASSASTVNVPPPPADSDDDSSHRKKKKHKSKDKKKRSHKKRKKRSQGTDDDDNSSLTHHYDMDSDVYNHRSNTSDLETMDDQQQHQQQHAYYGGKRPFSMIQEEEENDNNNNNDNDHDDYHGGNMEEDMYPQQHTSTVHPTDYHMATETHDEHGYVKTESMDHVIHPTSTSNGRHKKSRTLSNASSITKAAPKKRGRPAKNKTQPKPEPRIVDQPKKDLKTVCSKLLDSFIKKDSYGIFHYPVDTTLVQDYLDIIKNPMDFSTMSQKLENGSYEDLESFKQDVLLITRNSRTYNAPHTIYAKQADRIEDYAIKAIDKAAKTIVYGSPQQQDNTTPYTEQHGWSPRRLSSVSVSRKDSNVKMEEEVDILGLDNTSSYSAAAPSRKASRPMLDDVGSSRAVTPTKSSTTTKKKKKKVTDAGVVYSPDGSLVSIGGADVSMLIPQERHFAYLPEITTTNLQALPSAFFTNRNTYDEWSSNKHFIHPANFCDYGAFTALGQETPGAFYTAQDACYIYPLYGDDRGEAYIRSLWDFVDDLDLKDVVDQKTRQLTRGAWDVLKQALKGPENGSDVDTEFGTIHAADYKQAYDNVMEDSKAAPSSSSTTTTTTPTPAPTAASSSQ